MQREFLQEKSLNRSMDNAEKSVNVDLSAKSRLIPYSTAAGMLSLNKLFIEERDACENYRMIFTVNPICTNALYNAVTEPVYKEGSLSATNLVQKSIPRNSAQFSAVFENGTINQSGSSIDRIFSNRDTEISHEKIGDFKYHCGYDIFNNHLLRTNEFEHVEIETAATPINKNEFNTIFDFAVDYNGKGVKRVIGEADGPLNGSVLQRENVRLYQLGTIKTLDEAFYDGLRLVDGWYGFYNSGYIEIPNAKIGITKESISVNRVLNNETPCGFIDLYPDRTLFSFIPKVNRYRKRLERNWDCTIVYPYESDQETFNTLNGNNVNAVKVINYKIVYNNVGDALVQCHSLLRHTLSVGDTIRIFYAESGGTEGDIKRYSVPVSVVSVGNTAGDDTNRYFTIKLTDIETFCEIYENAGGKTDLVVKDSENKKVLFFYKKIENGYDDRYYFRKFKKLKNTETGNDLAYTQNKLAFAENIYGDRVAQVIFSDDICVTGLKDNLGRPLTTVYFMVEKTNRGYKEWYENANLTADTVEFSHCFGDVTSGLDLPADEESTEYNVRKLHNVFWAEYERPTTYLAGLKKIMEDAPTGNYRGTPSPFESGLTVEDNDIFYGDVVEFSKVKYLETPIERVYHRFNTAQRELLKNSNYFDIWYDNLIGDLYDVKEVNE